jgi:hypothetical protein
MNTLQNIIDYVRRIVKTPSNAQLSDALIIDYINRFYLMDVSARIQLYDYKVRYSFQTVPYVDQYNMPYYYLDTWTPGDPAVIAPYPVYQGFESPCYINGAEVPLMIQREDFFRIYPNYLQSLNPGAIGNGGSSYTFLLPYFPALRGHIDPIGEIANLNTPGIAGQPNPAVPITSVFSGVYFATVDANGTPMVVQDSGQFLTQNVGYLIGDIDSSGGWSTTINTVNYLTGAVNVTFSSPVPASTPINVQCYYFQPGMPRTALYFNNVVTLRPPPNTNYLVEMNAYLTPAAFLSTTEAIPFAYMAEYIARGAARKILSDTGDIEQFQFYEPLFREQEQLVWKRSQRTITSNRTPTIFSSPTGQSPFGNIGQGT